jgi:hypothetical protein
MAVAEEVIDAVTGELVPAREVNPGVSMTLFGTDDPVVVVEQATRTAQALAGVIEKQHPYTQMGSSRHVRVEGWTLLGSMLGVFAIPIWTRSVRDDNGEHIGWEARVEARTRSGDVVGAADAQCLRTENMWSFNPVGRGGKKLQARDDFALRSMAQTRAVSKALRVPLDFIVQLAGFNATPAEEMTQTERNVQRGRPQTVQLTKEEAFEELKQRQSRLCRIDSAWTKQAIFDTVAKATGEEVKKWEDIPESWRGSLLRQARHQMSGIEEELQIENGKDLEPLDDPPAGPDKSVEEAEGQVDPEAEDIPFGEPEPEQEGAA